MNLNSNYFWNEEEFLTGDNIEKLGDFVFDIENYLIGDHGRRKTNKTEDVLIEEQINAINLKRSNIIYCYGHDTQRLLKNIDKINHKFKLITHNSDIGILEEYLPYLENEKIIKWYGQNNSLNHPKTITLPIAIARKEYKHGDLKLLSTYSKNNLKKFLVYKNFLIETNTNERTVINFITTKNGIPMSTATDFNTYLSFLSKSVFFNITSWQWY